MKTKHCSCALFAVCAVAAALSACPPSPPAPPTVDPLADGSPCEDDRQCASGFCQGLPGEAALCRRACKDGCQPGEQCEALGVFDDPRHTCVPSKDTLCKRCQGSYDCAYPGDVCVELAGLSVCGRDCSFDGKCPPDSKCRDAVAKQTGAKHRQCLPSSGTCETSCSPGWTHCDANPNHRCETNIETDVNNCGKCGKVCANFNGTTKCEAGACVPTCNTGYADCDGDRSNGCEANLNYDARNCGACGKPCINTDGSSACQSGFCPLTCAAGKADCDGITSNGCETDLTIDPNNCGACARQCTNPNGSTACRGALCTPTCSTGFGDCDRNPNNGCEASTSGDVNNCGACGATCTNAHGTTACASGACVPVCSSGFKDCDGNAANGCERDVSTVSDCGACGRVCSNPHGTTACVGGSCSPTCTSGYRDCDASTANGCEADLSSVLDCGACGRVCANPHGTNACVGGNCSPTCATGWGNCDANPANGCETSTTTVTHCGACGVSCSRPNASATCSTGSCAVGSCNSGYSNCDGSDANGCERQLNYTLGQCVSTVDLGSVSGDTLAQYTSTYQGYDSRWFHVRVTENNSSCTSVSATVRLQSPSNMDYDLYVYSNGTGTCPPVPTLIGQSNELAGQLDSITAYSCDTSGVSNTYDLYIEVRYYSGTGQCGNWQLWATGNTYVVPCGTGPC